MWRDKEARRYMIGFVSAFLLFTGLRIAANSIDFTPERPFFLYMISQIGCVLIISCWMLTVQSRIIHRKVRRLMLGIGGLFLLYFFMQMIKYCLFSEDVTICRYMWYGYYTPMTLIPLLAFYILQYLSVPEESINTHWRLLAFPAVLICLAFLTNDFHQLVFGLPYGYEAVDKGRTLGTFYFFFIGYIALLFILGMRSMILMYRNRKGKKKLIYPAVPPVIGTLYYIMYAVKPEWIMANGVKLFEIPETFAFIMIGFLEVCIQIELIPSNMGYDKLFSLTGIPARIEDLSGNTVYATKGADNLLEESENHHVMQTAVTGGSFYYDVDLSVLNRLNRELDETTANLEARNELLRHENEIAEEREKSEAAIRIYDRISELVRPQILEIQKLLSEDPADEERFRKNLVRSAVLNAYVKRRSNMELEAQKDGTLPFKELVTATAETLEYLKLSGAEAFLSSSGEGSCPAGQICRSYHAFEGVAEAIVGVVDYVTVRLTLGDAVRIRFLLSGKTELPDLSGLPLSGCEMEYQKEESDTELLLCISEGGDGQ